MGKYFDILAFLMGKAAGGGGGDITVESKAIEANGTYTAPAGKAYSPVSVSVPNSYAAGDEGKVVSNGALVAQGSDTVTQNGTVDTTLINSLLVNVSGGGGGLEYEEGTWTPTEDVEKPTINFADSHTNPPISVILYDATGTENLTQNTNLIFSWSDISQLGGVPVSISSTSSKYAQACITVRATSTTSISSWTYDIKTPYSSTSASSDFHYRYWVTASSYSPFANQSGRYCRAGRTYKWIAVWASAA